MTPDSESSTCTKVELPAHIVAGEAVVTSPSSTVPDTVIVTVEVNSTGAQVVPLVANTLNVVVAFSTSVGRTMVPPVPATGVRIFVSVASSRSW